jgi:protein-S-isoprenylcysteine O-methyltransferase Ste14
MIRLALAAGWTLHTAQWLAALIRAGRGAAAPGEWAREVAIRTGMVALVVAAVIAPFGDLVTLGPRAVGVLLAFFFAGQLLAMAGRSALGEAWSIGTRTRSGAGARRRGLYAVIRHPIYAGTTTAAAAQAVLTQNVPGLLLLVGALAVVAAKIRAEERWLRARSHG